MPGVGFDDSAGASATEALRPAKTRREDTCTHHGGRGAHDVQRRCGRVECGYDGAAALAGIARGAITASMNTTICSSKKRGCPPGLLVRVATLITEAGPPRRSARASVRAKERTEGLLHGDLSSIATSRMQGSTAAAILCRPYFTILVNYIGYLYSQWGKSSLLWFTSPMILVKGYLSFPSSSSVETMGAPPLAFSYLRGR